GRSVTIVAPDSAGSMDGDSGHADVGGTIPMEAIRSILGPGGRIAMDGGFRHRPQQVEMSCAVAETLNSGTFRIIESGTGTGKTVAYLVPAALSALRGGGPVAVSTFTRALQQQIAERELPRVDRLVGGGLRWTILKGRENYVCPARLDARVRQPAWDDTAGDRLMLAVLVCAVFRAGASGDLDDISYWVQQQSKKSSQLFAEIRISGSMCDAACRFRSQCPYMCTLNRALSAHILVVNHALAMRWPVTYPAVTRFIFDEAHNLEDVATSVYGQAVTGAQMRRFLQWLADPKDGLVARAGMQEAAQILQSGKACIDAMIGAVDQVAIGSMRSLPDGKPVRHLIWHRAFGTVDSPESMRRVIAPRCRDLLGFWNRLRTMIGKRAQAKPVSTVPDADWEMARETLDRFCGLLERMLDRPEPMYLYSVQYEIDGECAECTWNEAPVSVAELVKNNLWDRLYAAVLTSATMTVNGKPHFFMSRLGLYFVSEQRRMDPVIVDSPFPYNRLMLAIHPAGLPDVAYDHPETGLLVHRSIIRQGVRYLRGRTLVLMASSRRMAILGGWLDTDLAAEGIEVLIQGRGSRDQLVNAFRADRGSLLMGLRSFWEGIDIPGPALRMVMIEKVPFQPVDEPLVKARMKAVENWSRIPGFLAYLLPLALIQLRQGIGRLVRSDTDDGVVVLLNRPISAMYRRQVAAMFPVPLITDRVWEGAFQLIRSFFEQGQGGDGYGSD
ncbi:ATP-dependent DNA helicase, partial [bacterium]|nr:ATP-dependent DNA helicase [candidate division CSSED10-310 bacterium]